MIEMSRIKDTILVTFPSEEFLGEALLPALQDKLQELLDEQKPSIVRFDLTDVALITSEILGFLVSLHGKGVKVLLCNPSADVRAVVEMTKLDQFLELVSDQPDMPTD
jgi:anti-anti-sigma factor